MLTARSQPTTKVNPSAVQGLHVLYLLQGACAAVAMHTFLGQDCLLSMRASVRSICDQLVQRSGTQVLMSAGLEKASSLAQPDPDDYIDDCMTYSHAAASDMNEQGQSSKFH